MLNSVNAYDIWFFTGWQKCRSGDPAKLVELAITPHDPEI
jgi:hypothetical protein